MFLYLYSTASDDGSEIFLSPAVTYGPPGLDLSYPIAMTIPHCAEVAADNWTIRLKRHIQDNKWEVSKFCYPSPVVNMFEFPPVAQVQNANKYKHTSPASAQNINRIR